MPLSRRYSPEFAPGEACVIGYDFSPIIPVGVGIQTGGVGLTISTNTAVPADANADFEIGPIQVQGRAIYCNLSGGVAGTDYQLAWTVVDTQGNTWVRTGLMLCASTS